MDNTPQVQKSPNQLLDPDTMAQIMGDSSTASGQSATTVNPIEAAITQAQSQNQAQNVLQQYLQQHQQAAQIQSTAPSFTQFVGDLKSLPGNAQNAAKYLGNQLFDAMCQKFAEQMTYGHSGIFPTAADAAQYYAQQGQLKNDYKNIKPGSLLYFAPDQSNGYAGHVGIYTNNGNMISATYSGVKQNALKDWVNSTGQRLLGYVPTGK